MNCLKIIILTIFCFFSTLVNAQEKNTELINNDPYNDGWIIKMKIKNIKEIDILLDSKSYKGFLD